MGVYDFSFKINPFQIRVILLEPGADLARAGSFKNYYDSRVILLDNAQEPAENKDIQPSEWEPIKQLIIDDFNQLGTSIANQLLSNTLN